MMDLIWIRDPYSACPQRASARPGAGARAGPCNKPRVADAANDPATEPRSPLQAADPGRPLMDGPAPTGRRPGCPGRPRRMREARPRPKPPDPRCNRCRIVGAAHARGGRSRVRSSGNSHDRRRPAGLKHDQPELRAAAAAEVPPDRNASRRQRQLSRLLHRTAGLGPLLQRGPGDRGPTTSSRLDRNREPIGPRRGRATPRLERARDRSRTRRNRVPDRARLLRGRPGRTTPRSRAAFAHARPGTEGRRRGSPRTRQGLEDGRLPSRHPRSARPQHTRRPGGSSRGAHSTT